MTAPVRIGDPSPAILLRDHDDKPFDLGSIAGPAVVFFYPKDDTSGCTAEAIAFQAQASAFADLGVTLVGISPDGVTSHAKFRAKHGLTLRLLADDAKEVAEAFGVWVEKKMYGRKYMGIERSTFLLGPDKRIVQIWSKVKVPGHADAVLDAARALETAG